MGMIAKRALIALGLGLIFFAAAASWGWAWLFKTQSGQDFLRAQIETQLEAALGAKAELSRLEGAPPGRIILRDLTLYKKYAPEPPALTQEALIQETLSKEATKQEGPGQKTAGQNRLDDDAANKAVKWLTLKRAELQWHPFDLIQRRINVQKITIEGLALIETPPSPPPQAEIANHDHQREEPIKGPQFPRRLPDIRIDMIAIEDALIGEKLLGSAARLNGDGTLKMGGEDLTARLSLKSDDGLDEMILTAALAPDNGPQKADKKASNKIDGRITSAENGVLSSLAGLNGPLRLTLTGAGPLQALPVKLIGDIGEYGAVEADINVALIARDQTPRGASIAGGAMFGPALITLSEQIGERIDFDLAFHETPDGGTLRLGFIRSDALTLKGEADWRNQSDALQQARATLSADFNEDYFAPVQTWLGQDATLSLRAKREKGAYRLNSALTAPLLTASLDEVQTNFQNQFEGALKITGRPHDGAPAPLRDGFDFSAALFFDDDFSADDDKPGGNSLESGEKATLKAEDMRLSLGGTDVFSGFFTYRLKNRFLDAAAALNLTPLTLASLIEEAKAEGPLYTAFSLKGPLDNLRAEIEGQTPALSLSAGTIPAANIEAAINGLPSKPNGSIEAIAAKPNSVTGTQQTPPPGRLSAVFRSTAQGLVSLRELQWVGAQFSLAGDGQFDEAGKMLDLNLTYRGQDGAAPFPGFGISGAFDAGGTLHWGDGVSDFALSLKDIVINGAESSTEISNATLTAQGPINALAIAAKADTLSQNGEPSMRDFFANIAVNKTGDTPLQDQIFIAVTGLGATLGTTPLALTQTATLTLDDGIKIDNVAAKIGDGGSARFNGAFRADHWQAQASIMRAPTPAAAALVSADFTLDTDQKIWAQGDFSLRADTASKDDQDAIKAQFIWAQNALTLKSDDGNNPLFLDIRLPLALMRAPGLSLSTKGALTGVIKYDGPIAPLAAFGPPPAQGLEGALFTDLVLSGALDAPILDGMVKISDGAYTELSTGLSLVDINAEAQASLADGETAISITGGARGDGQDKQTITLSGDMTLGAESQLDGEITFDDARFSAAPVTRLRLRGGMSVAGPLDALAATGDIIIDGMNIEIITPEVTGLAPIEVIAIDQNGQLQDNMPPPPAAAPIDIDVSVTANDKIFLRGRGLDSEWAAKIRMQTIEEQPILLGGIDLRRGTLDFSGRRFELTQGEIIFDKLSPNNPIVDMRAEYETADAVTAAIIVKGRAGAPSITLQSSPTLPKEDIMALVLFGKAANELSAIESLQMAQALASLGGIGPFGGGGGLTGSARDALGLDLLNVDLDTQTGASALTVGKYIAEGLFVSATQDVKGEKGSVRIEYEIRDNITVETELAQDGDQTLSANWKRDF